MDTGTWRGATWSTFGITTNALLVHLVGRIPDTQMDNPCVIGLAVQTLGFVMEDYVVQMQHDLDHILSRETITPYPNTATGL